ncbi:telomere stability and silencing-domain-containing protein [Ganoderma leucocontextum]|nr:telomere stability and silencing-domain-containing protein [Ganoderma leucocontextum]
MSTSIIISTFPPFPTLALSAPSETSFADLYELLANRYPSLPLHSHAADLVLSPTSGPIPEAHTLLSTLLWDEDDHPHPLVTLRLVPRLRGGKGGFGSQLRAAGGRMSSQKTSNNDSCRDLSGRRLSTIKEAKRLAEYIESEPLRKKAQQEAQRAKLETLERKLGISADGSSSDPVAGKKHRLEDNEYIEQSREIVDNVKNAVSSAMLKKKKKKAKTTHSPPADAGSSAAAATTRVLESASSVSDKILESAATAPIAAAAAVAVGVASS